MINYSISKLGNPGKPAEAKKYYGRVQFTDTLDLTQFAHHVASHSSKYNEGDIYAVMCVAVDYLEVLGKLGYKVSFGKLGAFYPSISSQGAASLNEFSADNILSLSVNWDRPKRLDDIKEGVTFNKVFSRALQATMRKKLSTFESDELLEQVNALQKDVSAVSPDKDEQPGDGTDSGGSTSSGGSNNDDPNG